MLCFCVCLCVIQEREEYKRMKAACQAVCEDNQLAFGPSAPASKDMTIHYSFDFAQNMMYPHDSWQPGPIYFLTPRKCSLFGVCCEGLPSQVNYLIDECVGTGKGSNAVISYLHHFFQNYGMGETKVQLHCDNCSGQNKNSFMMWYLSWRVMHKLHLEASLHFLIAGHTKFAPDWCFGLIKKLYRKSRVDTLADIAQVVEESSPVKHVNIPQLVGNEDGRILVQSYNWQEHLKPYFRSLPGIKSYHHFRFSADKPGLVWCKRTLDDTEKEFQLLREPGVFPPLSQLPLLQPAGLDDTRQQYLYQSIRSYVKAPARDITCPEPKEPRSKPRSKNLRF